MILQHCILVSFLILVIFARTSPFLGVPQDQGYLKSEDGKHFLRLKPETLTLDKRALGIPIYSEEDEEDLEWSYESSLERIKEVVFGKSEVTQDLEQLLEGLRQSKKRFHLGSSSDEYAIVDYGAANAAYLISVFLGTSARQTYLVFDTGSSWAIVQSANCDTCFGYTWDEDTSSTFERDYPYFDRNYGSAQTEGFYVHDDFYLDGPKTFGIEMFDFFLIDYANGISPYGGILGFARDIDLSSGESYGPLLYKFLYKDSQIDSMIFSSFTADAPYEPFVQIGGYDETGEYYDGDLIWINVNHNFFWMADTKGLIVDGKAYDPPEDEEVLLDSGSTGFALDKKTGKKVMKKLIKGTRGFSWFGSYYMQCEYEKFQSMFLEIGGYYFEIPPETYILDWRELNNKKYCTLAVQRFDRTNWIAGETFLRNYYTVWDDTNSQVAFGVIPNQYVSIAPYES